jgi:hypothetical protein
MTIETCPHCGLTDIEYSRTCHNSACSAYAREESFYRGWQDAAPQAECAPREAQPVDQCLRDLRRAHEYLDKGKPFFTGKDCAELADLIESLASPTPERAQPVGPRTTLNYDGTFDTPCAHCGGNGCFACLKSAAPTPEHADADTAGASERDALKQKGLDDHLRRLQQDGMKSEERADAEKDAALTDARIEHEIEISGGYWVDGEFRIDCKDLMTLCRAILGR